MIRRILFALVASTAVLFTAPASAEERATPEQAQALVKRAITYYKAHGRQKSLAEFSNKNGGFIDRDLYVNVYDMQGNCLAHINEKQVGKNLIDLRDPDGKYIIKDRIEGLKTADTGWQEYKFYNPATKKVEPKRMYYEKHDGIIFSAGAYRPM